MIKYVLRFGLTATWLPYGKGQVELGKVPGSSAGFLKPNSIQPLAPDDIPGRIRNYFSSAHATANLQHGRQTTIVVPDKTRNCAARILLPEIVKHLAQLDVSPNKITILLANGSHGLHSSDEVEHIVGPDIRGRFTILEHDARNPADLRYFGKSPAGTPVWLNKHVVDADNLIIIGTVVHHYFAGFGGGPKMIMPGCAGYETIRLNHALTIDSNSGDIHAGCRCGNLAGNPLQEDIANILRTADVRVSTAFTSILNDTGEIVDLFCGDMNETHAEAGQVVDRIYRIDIERRTDLVIASCGGFPKDINLIQTHKTIYNAFQAVRPGGVLIVLAECPQGIGSQTFFDYFSDGSEDMIERLVSNYALNGTTALSIRQKCRDAKIILISALDDATITKVGMLPANSLPHAIELAAEWLPQSSTYYVMENGSLTVPWIVS